MKSDFLPSVTRTVWTDLTRKDANSDDVQEQVEKLYNHINGFFDRSISLNGILLWGKMLVSGGDIGIMQIRVSDKKLRILS